MIEVVVVAVLLSFVALGYFIGRAVAGCAILEAFKNDTDPKITECAGIASGHRKAKR